MPSIEIFVIFFDFFKVESGGAVPANLAQLRVAFPGPAGAGLPLVLHVEVVAVRFVWRHFFVTFTWYLGI